MSSVNKAILLGNLGKDPEVRHLDNGKVRTTFTLATHDTYKSIGGEKFIGTEWHNVVLWTPIAEIGAQYLSKGKQVYIEGRITTRSYVDNEGQARYVTEIAAQHMVLLGSKSGGASSTKTAEATQKLDTSTEESTAEESTNDGLPF